MHPLREFDEWIEGYDVFYNYQLPKRLYKDIKKTFFQDHLKKLGFKPYTLHGKRMWKRETKMTKTLTERFQGALAGKFINFYGHYYLSHEEGIFRFDSFEDMCSFIRGERGKETKITFKEEIE